MFQSPDNQEGSDWRDEDDKLPGHENLTEKDIELFRHIQELALQVRVIIMRQQWGRETLNTGQIGQWDCISMGIWELWVWDWGCQTGGYTRKSQSWWECGQKEPSQQLAGCKRWSCWLTEGCRPCVCVCVSKKCRKEIRNSCQIQYGY